MADITYEHNKYGNNYVRIKEEYVLPDSSFNRSKSDVFLNADLILTIKGSDISILKNRYGYEIGNQLDPISIINLFVDSIIASVSTKVELFDDGIKKQIKDSIFKILEYNKLI